MWFKIAIGVCAAVFVSCELVRSSPRVSRATARLLQIIGFGFALVGAVLALWAVFG
jgi:hypothetical protein